MGAIWKNGDTGEPTDQNWCGLDWTAWVPFIGGDFATMPAGPGVYRVRVLSQSTLTYLGQTGRSLRERLRALRRHTLAGEMPFNDPHTAAPSLWAWAHAEGYTYECSAAATSIELRERLALECWLLWKHRLATGSSVLCNHGQFHPRYTKSRNRSTGHRGGLIEQGADLAVPCVSQRPLLASGEPTGLDWMGLPWTPWRPLGAPLGIDGVALYRLRVAACPDLLYIGETLNVVARMMAHAKTYRELKSVEVSCLGLPVDSSKWSLHELENDLLGCYFDIVEKPPAHQFANTKPVDPR